MSRGDGRPNLKPWDGTFAVANVAIVAETPELRVLELTLTPGETVPWHAHPETPDIFYCIEGTIDVHEKGPAGVHRLPVGATHTTPPRRPHLVHNPTAQVSRFLNVQGPGEYDYLPIGDQQRPDFEPLDPPSASSE